MKLVLVCHGVTASMRRGGFPAADEPVEEAVTPRRVASVATGPALAPRQTAAMLHPAPVVVAALRDIDHGSWAGRSFADVQADAPAALADWLARPWQGTPDGEDFRAVCMRVAAWIEADTIPDVVVTHPMVIRAMLTVTIGLSAEAAMRVDIVPLSTVVLSRHRGWRLQRLGGTLDD